MTVDSMINELIAFYIRIEPELNHARALGYDNYVITASKIEAALLVELGYKVELHDWPEYEALADENTKIGYKVWFK